MELYCSHYMNDIDVPSSRAAIFPEEAGYSYLKRAALQTSHPSIRG